MKFEAKLSKRAFKELSVLDSAVRRRIILKIEEMQIDPYPRGSMKLQGRDGVYRVRIGDYRILYEVLTDNKLLLIEKIDHRSSVYE